MLVNPYQKAQNKKLKQINSLYKKKTYNQQWDPSYEIVKGYLSSVIDGIHKGSIIAKLFDEYSSIYKNVVTKILM